MRLAPRPHSRDCGASLAKIVLAPSPHPPICRDSPARPQPPPVCTPTNQPPTSEPTNRHVMPGSHKHQQERSITDRSGQQYPGEIAAGGPEAPGGTARRKDPGTRGAGRLAESHTRKPESKLAEKLSKVEKAFQNAVIKEIMADFGLEGVTKKRLSRYHRE